MSDSPAPSVPEPEAESSPQQPGADHSASSWPFVVILGALALVVALMVANQGSDSSGPGSGSVVAQVRLVPLLYTQEPLGADSLRGEVVLLNFWGTWCRPCRDEFPHLFALYRKLRPRDDFRLVAVSCLPPGEPFDVKLLREETQAFLDQFNAQMPIYADPEQQTRRELDRLGAWPGAYPTTVLLDRQGRIRYQWVGYRPGTEVEMEQQILKLLAEK